MAYLYHKRPVVMTITDHQEVHGTPPVGRDSWLAWRGGVCAVLEGLMQGGSASAWGVGGERLGLKRFCTLGL